MARTSNSRRKTGKTTASRAGKKTTTAYAKGKTTAEESAKIAKLQYEIIVISILVFAFFVMLTVYFNVGGAVGSWIKGLLFGVFGFGAYLLPIYLFVGAAFKIFNQKSNKLTNKLIQGLLLIVVIAALSHISYIRDSQIDKVLYKGKPFQTGVFFPTLIYYFDLSRIYHFAGGFIGGLIGDLFVLVLDRIGAYIILILMGISLLILITEQSAFEALKLMVKGIKALAHKVMELFAHIKAARVAHLEEMEKAEPKPKKIKKEKAEKESAHDVVSQIRDSEIQSKKQGFNLYELEQDKEIIPNPPEELKAMTEEEIIKQEILDEKPDKPVQISFFRDKKEVQKENTPDRQTMKKIDTEIVMSDHTPQNKTMYEFPPLELLKDNPFTEMRGSKAHIQKNVIKLQETLENFGVNAKVVNVSCGPTVTRYEIKPDIGVKVNKIVNLADDIALHLAADGIRIEAPIPGKALVGIEIPNKETSAVFIKEVIASEKFKNHPSKIAFALGKDIGGEVIISNIATMPHMLICGATGAGKSVCINSIIISILYRAHPDEVKLVMIDPKVVELKIYNDIPHLLIPVVTDPKKAAGALVWATSEMQNRYKLFAEVNVRDIKGFNDAVELHGDLKKLPQIVVIVDELADLMQVAAREVEDSIKQLAAMARAAGIHLLLATQRPSVDVITGIIKANIPSRIAFSVSSSIDSRTIIDGVGAEKLIGKGDMLYLPRELQKPIRVQGTYISDGEIEAVVNFLKATQKTHYDKSILEKIESVETLDNKSDDEELGSGHDEKFDQVLEFIIEVQKASASMIQRKFSVGFTRAARMIDQLEEAGFIGPAQGSKPREVRITYHQYLEMKRQAINDQNKDSMNGSQEDDDSIWNDFEEDLD